MPLGAPIGTNKGVRTRDNIAIIIEQASVPVVVDAGLGAPSHAAEAMEMGADAEDIAKTVHAHPTLSETFAFAAEIVDGSITDALPVEKK